MAKAKQTEVPAKTYKCVRVCRYKDTTYAVDDTVELGEREAEFLVNSGNFAPVLTDAEAAAVAKAEKTAADKLAAEQKKAADAEAAKAKAEAEADAANKTTGEK